MFRAMCVLALTSLITAASVPSRSKEEWKRLANASIAECKAELNVSDDEYAAVTGRNKSHVDVDSHKKCVLRCYELKVLGPFSTFDEWVEKVVDFIEDFFVDDPEEKQKKLEIFNSCQVQIGSLSDECDTIVQIYSCCRVHFARVGLKFRTT